MLKRIIAAGFAATVVLVPMSAPANAAEKAPSTKAIDWESVDRSPGKVGTLRIDWE